MKVESILVENSLSDYLILSFEWIRDEMVEPGEMQDSNNKQNDYYQRFKKGFDVMVV